VHGGDAYAALQLHPVPSRGASTLFNAHYHLKQHALKKKER